jgi:hypothetical protein
VLALRRANAEHLSVMEVGRWLSPGYGATTVFIRDRLQREYDPARCLVHADRPTVSQVGATDAMQAHRLAQVRVVGWICATATCSATATRVRLKFRQRLLRVLGVRPATASNAMGVRVG